MDSQTDSTKLDVSLPRETSGLSQDEEYCLVRMNGTERKIRFHDYSEIYEIPGLYEHIFYEKLRCTSPEVVTSLLADAVEETDESVSDLVVLDLGAGNGMVGEALVDKGVDTVIGVDIIEEAAEAALRDRPQVYDDYFVEDFCDIDRGVEQQLKQADPNCLVCVAALGFDDIPAPAFANGFNLVEDDGWVAFNIKEEFVNNGLESDFSHLIRQIIEDGTFELVAEELYRHRLAIDGSPLNYLAMVGKKHSDIDEGVLAG